ncbi:MAG: hypothetical protein IPN69_21040 [Acidobacteria bacterium]|nr:hypothetical protein [Acidobacteriota bacterium]
MYFSSCSFIDSADSRDSKHSGFQVQNIPDSRIKVPGLRFRTFQIPNIPDSRFQVPESRFQIPSIPSSKHSRFQVPESRFQTFQ